METPKALTPLDPDELEMGAAARRSYWWEGGTTAVVNLSVAALTVPNLSPWFWVPVLFITTPLVYVLSRKTETWWYRRFVIPPEVLAEECAALREEVEQLREEVSAKKHDQELADFLTEQVKYATTELLNAYLIDDDSRAEWINRERVWRESLLGRMGELGCTRQEIQEVELLVTYTPLHLHEEPWLSNKLSQLVERIGRIRSIAKRYSE